MSHLAKRHKSNGVRLQPSSSRWHPAGGDSLWWRHYGEPCASHLYKQCSPSQDAVESSKCCSLHNMHASQSVFLVPSCCRANLLCTPESFSTKSSVCNCTRVAVFDLDGTLITTRSGKKFPRDSCDWKLLHETLVPAQLRRLHDEGYFLFIVSNQLGVTLGHVTLLDVTSKVDAIQKELKVPLTCCLCCCDDLYRKPRPTGAAFLFHDLLPRVQALQTVSSSERRSSSNSGVSKYPRVFFVGDAAGRPQDHSCADLKFALNVGLHFFTPEEFFLGKAAPSLPLVLRRLKEDACAGSVSEEQSGKEQLVLGNNGKLQKRTRGKSSNSASLDPFELLKCCPMPKAVAGEACDDSTDSTEEARMPSPLQRPGQELVVLVGAPGSGKSTYVARVYPNHAVVRQDELKNRAKCLEVCSHFLREGKSVVIDRQNATQEDRRQFIDLARKHAPDCSLRSVALLWPKELCLHLGQFRSLAATLRARRTSACLELKAEKHPLLDSRYRVQKVPKVVIDKFYAHVEPPTVEEGFDTVQILQDTSKDFILFDDFCSSEERHLFGSFLD